MAPNATNPSLVEGLTGPEIAGLIPRTQNFDVLANASENLDPIGLLPNPIGSLDIPLDPGPFSNRTSTYQGGAKYYGDVPDYLETTGPYVLGGAVAQSLPGHGAGNYSAPYSNAGIGVNGAYLHRNPSQVLSALPTQGNVLLSQDQQLAHNGTPPYNPFDSGAGRVLRPSHERSFPKDQNLEYLGFGPNGPVFRALKADEPNRYDAELPRQDDEHRWVRTNKVKASYITLPHPLGTWRSRNFEFTYNHHGELSEPTYSAKQIREFIYDHPEIDGCKLTLWIQKTPADSARRYPTERSSKCRFRNCPMQLHVRGNIKAGHFRVAFDERWSTTRDQTDPIKVAGYAHLYCMERFLDFETICTYFTVRVDERRLRKEPKGRFAATLERQDEGQVAFGFIELCRLGSLRADKQWRDYPAHLPGSHETPKPHKNTLTYAMMDTKERARPAAQARVLASRGSSETMAHVHLGDLEMIARNAKGAKYNIRPIPEEDDEEEDLPRTRVPRPAEDTDDEVADDPDFTGVALPPLSSQRTAPSKTSRIPSVHDIVPESTLRRSSRGSVRFDYREPDVFDTVAVRPQRSPKKRQLQDGDVESSIPPAKRVQTPPHASVQNFSSPTQISPDPVQKSLPSPATKSQISPTDATQVLLSPSAKRSASGELSSPAKRLASGNSRRSTVSLNIESDFTKFIEEDWEFGSLFGDKQSSGRNSLTSRKSSRSRRGTVTSLKSLTMQKLSNATASDQRCEQPSEQSPGDAVRRSPRLSLRSASSVSGVAQTIPDNK